MSVDTTPDIRSRCNGSVPATPEYLKFFGFGPCIGPDGSVCKPAANGEIYFCSEECGEVVTCRDMPSGYATPKQAARCATEVIGKAI